MSWLALSAVLLATGPVGPSPFASCALPEDAHPAYDDLLCLYRVGAQHGALAEARARLQALGGGSPQRPWATLVLAHATLEEDEGRAIALYQAAAAGFAEAGAAEGEVLARHNLRNIHHRRGEAGSAARQVERARAAAEVSGDALAVARASVLEAAHLIESGGDLGRAHRTLLRGRRSAFPDAPIGLRRSILFNLANVSLYLGRLEDAVEALERHRALRAEDGSPVDAAAVAFNLLNARLTAAEERPRPAARVRLLHAARQTLVEVEGLDSPAIAARTHRVLADLLRAGDPERAALHLERCLELEAPLGHPELRASCLWSLSLHEATRDPARAERLSRAAVSLAVSTRSAPLLAFAWQARLRLVWQTLPEDEAAAASLRALDAIERLRAKQEDEASRAALFSTWTRDYYWLTGRLLQARPSRMAEAFAVGERLRARVLLERLARAGLAPVEEPGRRTARRALLERMVDVQRRLLDPTLDASKGEALLERLRILELDERELSGEGTAARDLEFASLEAVQAALEDGEALLWSSVAPWTDLGGDFGGGSWLLTVTRHRVDLHHLPSRVALESQVAALVGLLRRRDTPVDVWAPGAVRLGQALLGPALAGLSSEVKRLIVVSDGILHRLPLEALRAEAGAPALGERFEVVFVPSATLWLRLRRTPPHAGGALVLADPGVRGRPLGERRLEPLPWARREARAASRAVGRSLMRQGGDASERFLKETSLGPFGILHLAAHSRADDAFPERSAVFLAPGAADEDGWLQPREIAALGLEGRLVVLSACESADGALLSGEGPLSLARAFFAAGARAVLATRWPLRDDDAAFMVERFYRALGSGEGVPAALRRARRDALASGRPAAAWAGLVLLGDAQPPVVVEQPARPTPYAFLFLATALAAAAWVIHRTLRSR